MPLPQLQLPPKVEYWKPDDDEMHDLRTDRALTAEQRQAEGYVPFSRWFMDTVRVYIDHGADPQYAAAFVAQDLVRPFIQELKQ